MEAVFAPSSSSADQSLPPYKQVIKNPQHLHLIYESLPPMSNNGILLRPPNRSVSFSLPRHHIPCSYYNPIQQLQPPLLPLPNSNLVKTKETKKVNNSPRKPTVKQPNSILKKARSSQDLASRKDYHGFESSSNGLSRRLSKDLLPDLDKFSGSLYAVSPPPSSLPLPKFTIIRPSKVSCKAEVDNGATHYLRGLLRLP